MRWDPEVIAHVAAGAGFTGEALVEAVALALASSGGDDAWSWTPSTAAGPTQRGLWALVPGANGVPGTIDPHDPFAAATGLLAAYEANGRTWDWHPVAARGVPQHLTDAARIASGSPRSTQPARLEALEPAASDELDRSSRAIDEEIRTLATFNRALEGLGR